MPSFKGNTKKDANRIDAAVSGSAILGMLVFIGIILFVIYAAITVLTSDKPTTLSDEFLGEHSRGYYGSFSAESRYYPSRNMNYDNAEPPQAITSPTQTQSADSNKPSTRTGYGRPVIDTSGGDNKEHNTFPDVLLFGNKQAHHVYKNELGSDEIHEDTWGSHQVGTINKDWSGSPESVTLNGETYEIKTTISGDKVLVDKDGKAVADFQD